MRYRVTLEYDGSAFVGWQRQPGGRTVQGVLEEAIAAVTGTAATVVGAGRTDAGVHAHGQVAHFDSPWERAEAELRKAMNAVLPWDVAVRALAAVPDSFHARHSALWRRYRYRIWNGSTRSPLRRRRSWHVPGALDSAAMAAAGRLMEGTRDFQALGRPMRRGGATVRHVKMVEVGVDGQSLTIAVEANAFLRHQVRRMVGLLVAVGRRQASPADVERVLKSGVASTSARRAPAQGLVLEKVSYSDARLHGRAGNRDEVRGTSITGEGAESTSALPGAKPGMMLRGPSELEVLQ